MSLERDLEQAYKRYLTTPLEDAEREALCALLDAAGLVNEGRALRSFFAHGAGPVPSLSSESAPWFAGPDLPQAPKPGAIWFDVVELAAMQYVPAPQGWSSDLEGWVRLRPVSVWQFRAFAELVRLGAPQLQWPVPDDLLAPERFANQPGLKAVVDLYFEEAVAYARWFGKFLCGQDDLYAAQQFMTQEAFDAVLPSGLLLWDEREHPESQFKRVAVGRETLERDPFAPSASGEAPMVFEEWGHANRIGFSTLASRTGLLATSPRTTPYFSLENSAPRVPA